MPIIYIIIGSNALRMWNLYKCCNFFESVLLCKFGVCSSNYTQILICKCCDAK